MYDIWISNSINTTDGRNERNVVKISKRKYNEQFDIGITNRDVIEEKRNKRGILYYFAGRKIVTTTIRTLLHKLSEKGISVSIGSLFKMKPFYITTSTEKEMALCLCKLCLNARLCFRKLIQQAKKDDDFTTDSITEFFLHTAPCPKTENGYYSWKCVRGNCQECKDAKPPQLKCASSKDLVTIYQFEVTKTPYKKVDQNGKVI